MGARRKNLHYFVLLLLIALWPTAHLYAAQSPQKTAKPNTVKVRISQSAVSARSTVLWIAQELGLFAKHGIEMEVIYLRSSPLQMTALATGEVQFASSGGSPMLSAVSSGQDLKIIAAPGNRLAYDLVVRPEIKEAKDLRGKRFGVTSIGGTLWMGGVLGLEKLGLDIARDDIKVLVIGDQVVLSQALEDNRIDATVLDLVFSKRLAQKGFSILAELHKTNLPITSTSIVARQAYIQKNPQLMENFMKAVMEGIAFVLGPPNKAATLKLLQKRLHVSEREAEEGFVDMLIGMDKKPFPSMEGLRNIQRLMKLRNPKMAGIKLEDLVDDQILRRLDESGFIDKLFATHGVK
jgi:ABC-type nitrate/sulfonate/bicarbonate transport system substrate-binding protein